MSSNHYAEAKPLDPELVLHPERISEALKSLYSQSDPSKAFDLLPSVANYLRNGDLLPHPEFQAILISGLQDVLLDILLREKFYAPPSRNEVGVSPESRRKRALAMEVCLEAFGYHQDENVALAAQGLKEYVDNMQQSQYGPGVTQSTFVRFCDEVVASETDAGKLRSRFIQELKEKTNLNHDLEVPSLAIVMTLPHCRQLHALEARSAKGPLLFTALVHACLRQLCMGRPHTEDVAAIGLDMAAYALRYLVDRT
ncbi:hypothetical protein EIP86_009460 [Pleurotus ostreatoroseus]|nr:hypothetical protein EIP86_009460 [Pleurotus ostreatoroseus]